MFCSWDWEALFIKEATAGEQGMDLTESTMMANLNGPG